MQRHVWWRSVPAACALLGFVLPVASRMAAGPRGADVHVERLEGDVRPLDLDRLVFTVSQSAVTLGPLPAEGDALTTGRQ